MTEDRLNHNSLNKVTDSDTPSAREPIALIGIGCRFPGGINSPDTFWQLLCDEIDAITEMPPGRSDIDSLYDPTPTTPGKVVTREGGFVENIDMFDAYLFGISPREAHYMDPQQRLLLEVAWEALEDGGQVPAKLAGSQTGVFIGMWTNDYEDTMYDASNDVDLYVTTGGGRYAASGRLSYIFDFRGPSLTLDTACSSSLVAVHLACQSLWNKEATLAVAGGANLILEPLISIGYSRSKILSPDARCKFGDAKANGYVRSEGVGLVVLKPLSQALADKDPIYALIRGGAVNNDGRGSELLVAPSSDTQAAVLREAYHHAGVCPGQVGYVEAHGTGTYVGDPVELKALGAVLAENRPSDSPCIVGSVKTNIGHTEAAAGVAGLIKAALCLKHQAIPASLHFNEPNANIPWSELPLVLQRTWGAWPDGPRPALASVNSFGITGTNAHVVLQEPPRPETVADETTAPTAAAKAHLIPVTAHSAEALKAMAQSDAKFIRDEAEAPVSIQDFGYTKATRRTHHDHRLALLVHNQQELGDYLDAYAHDETRPEIISGQKTADSQSKIVFVFSGQGSHWLGMGRQLLEQEPIFRQTLEQCEEAMRPFVNWPLLEQLVADPDTPTYRLNETDVMQPTLVSIEIGLAALWQSWGVEPDAVIGHSLGEIAAAYIAGALSLSDTMRVICARSRLMRQASGKGAMAVVELTVEEAATALAGYEDRLSIALSNSPHSTVISGDPQALNELMVKLQSQNIFCQRVNVDIAFHSPQMDPLKPDLFASLTDLQPQTAILPIYSTALGVRMNGKLHDADYWVQNLRQPVLFSKMVQELLADDHKLFIEMSPHPILSPAIQQTLQFTGQDGLTLPSMRRNQPELTTILGSLGKLYTLGYSINWDQLYPNGGQCLKLPLYPWQRERFWIDQSGTNKNKPIRHTRPGSHPLLENYLQSANNTHFWESELNFQTFPYLRDHQVQETAIFPAAAFSEMALAAAIEAFGPGPHTLEKAVFKEALILSEDQGRVIQLVITPDMSGMVAFEFFSRSAEQTEAQTWILHASGKIRLAQTDTATSPSVSTVQSVGEIRPQEPLSSADHYQAMTARGLEYGPSFQAVSRFWRQNDREVVGELQAPTSIADEVNGYRLHPSLLDACFQLLITTLEVNGSSNSGDTYLPVSLDNLQIYAQPTPGRTLQAQAIRHARTDMLAGDVFLFDENDQVIMAARGLLCQRLERDSRTEIKDWLYEIKWQPQPLSKQSLTVPDQSGTWLVFADRMGVGQTVASQLDKLGETPVMVFAGESYQSAASQQYRVNPVHADDFHRLLKDVLPSNEVSCRGIVYLWSLDSDLPEEMTLASLKSAQEQGSIGVLHLIQALNTIDATPSPRLWLVTGGTQAVGADVNSVALAHSPLWGLGGVITHEHPALHCTRIDLSSAVRPEEIEGFFQTLWSTDQEEQIAFRGDNRYVARLLRYQPKTEPTSSSETNPVELSASDQPFRVEITTPGILDNLTLRAMTRQEPKPGEVEIEIHATGLNFMNVMAALGILPGYANGVGPLGIECAGKISAVGEGVTNVQIGDEVVAVAFDSLGSHAVTDAHLVVPKPANLDFETAATIPIVFLTAYYALYHLGRLAKDERILIHSGAGGVGLAAIQLAQRVKAEIFTTAGSEEKRDLLRSFGVEHVLDSRSLAFADDITARTNGEGIDMILNSLSGDAIAKGFSILRAYGRFLEIGKRDIYQNSQLDLFPFQKNLSYFAIDLDRMSRERPALVGSLLQEIMDLMETGELTPIPHKTFPVSEVAEAFRYMAQAKHIGKVIISTQDPSAKVAPAVTTGAISLRSDGTYLLTGGLGGLGLSIAKSFAHEGAGHLVLMGRSEPSAAAQTIIAELEATGVQVMVAQADVTDANAVNEVLTQVKESMPPLRGIVHAAGIVDDGVLLQLDRERFNRVLAPKLDGAWNLHTLTRDLPLDHFILFSSVTVLLGSAGQGNYVAGNAFLDALAHHRRVQGQPALSLNWGPWSEVGMAAVDANRGERLASRGLASITPEQGTIALAQVLQQDAAQVGIMPFDLEQWCQFYPSAAKSALFSQLHKETVADETQEQTGGIQEALLAEQSGRRRRSLFETYLRDQVAQVIRLAAAKIPVDKPLNSLGLDSLMTLELRNRLEASLGLNLPATMTWNYPTIAALAPYLADKMGIPLETTDSKTDNSMKQPGSQEDDKDLTLKTQLEDVSEDEMETLLTEELAAIDDLLKGI